MEIVKESIVYKAKPSFIDEKRVVDYTHDEKKIAMDFFIKTGVINNDGTINLKIRPRVLP